MRILVLSLVVLFSSCRFHLPEQKTSIASADSAQNASKPAFDSTRDTVLFITGIPAATHLFPEKKLNDSIARITLYNHFRKKGYLINASLDDAVESDERLNVSYTGINITDINHHAPLDAIVHYWLAPVGANGHCVQPHHAIIVDSDEGFSIIAEEFLPDNYFIDSVISIQGIDYFRLNKYNCGAHEIEKKYSLRLK